MSAQTGIVEAAFVAGVADNASLPPPALSEVAFAGRSNVGKSSLLNTLTGRRNLVRAGRTPGTTRQLNFFRVRAGDGLELFLVDLPGYGFARRGKDERARWGALIEGYLLHRVTLRAVVLLIDARRGVEQEERDLAHFLDEGGANRRPPKLVAVATKLDKLPPAARKPAVLRIGADLGGPAFGFSAATGEGRDALWKALRDVVAAPG
jgi:GTP-binding protein